MSEGDSIHWLARRMSAAIAGTVPDEIHAPHPRTRARGWPERLEGRRIEGIDARGKHLLVRFEGGLVLHSHLAMRGAWRIRDRLGARLSQSARPARGAWVDIRSGPVAAVQYGGPTLDLLTAARARSLPRLRLLGPDICAREFDEAEVVRRLRNGDPRRGIGDALLDQRVVAGIGNLWKVEACWLAEVDPWRPVGRVGEEELLRILAEARPRMRDSAANGKQWRFKKLYGTAGRPCPRCGTAVKVRRGGDAARPTWWCPGCQR